MLSQFFRRLFGKAERQAEGPSIEYKGYTIIPILDGANGQYYTRGIIRKSIDGVLQESEFIRADQHPLAEQAQQHSYQKAKQIIDERGDRLFE